MMDLVFATILAMLKSSDSDLMFRESVPYSSVLLKNSRTDAFTCFELRPSPMESGMASFGSPVVALHERPLFHSTYD